MWPAGRSLPTPAIDDKVPLALRSLKDFNAPGKLESGVL